MRASYSLVKRKRIRRKVTFLSRQSNTPSADFVLLSKMIKEAVPDVEIAMLTKMIEGHLLSYPFHVLRQIGHIASSRLVIIDGYCIPVSCLDLKPGTKVIQTWHAQTAVKKFGLQTVGKPSGSSKEVADVMRMHRNYDHVIAPSKDTALFFSDGMGTDISKFVLTFMPHTVKMIEEAAVIRKEMRGSLGLDDSKRTILYAPTFRKGKKVPANELFVCIDKEKYDFIFRPHPLDADLETLDKDMKVDMKSSIYDLITASDIVITDYSSIMVETMLMEKDMYIFAYDIDEYRVDPGLNIDLADGICDGFYFTSPEEISDLLEKGYDRDSAERLRAMLIGDDVPVDNDRMIKLVTEILTNDKD